MKKLISEWKNAVVHLECATDSLEYEGLREQLKEKVTAGELTDLEYVELLFGLPNDSKDIRYQGTAVFFQHEGKRYLMTARHVVHDELRAMRAHTRASNEWHFSELRERKFFEDTIFQTIFKVTDYNDFLSGDESRISLHGLGSGYPPEYPYTFSSPSLDLAIISLDQRGGHHTEFANELQRQGKIPITLDDIADEPEEEGADIIAIGYPNTSEVHQLTLPSALKNWRSESISLPISTFGKVAMLHETLDYFWGDISIYPGNSGGPVISSKSGKLVGFVSAQATVPAELRGPGGEEMRGIAQTRVPIARIIKAKHIKQLLEQQIIKDNRKADFSWEELDRTIRHPDAIDFE